MNLEHNFLLYKKSPQSINFKETFHSITYINTQPFISNKLIPKTKNAIINPIKLRGHIYLARKTHSISQIRQPKRCITS